MDLEDSFESDFNAKLEDGSPYEVRAHRPKSSSPVLCCVLMLFCVSDYCCTCSYVRVQALRTRMLTCSGVIAEMSAAGLLSHCTCDSRMH